MQHELIGGKLKVVSVLGEGGMGIVYLAEHNVLERLFAVKVLREDLLQDEVAVERFRREARAASRLQHRNIVYISDFGQLEDGRLYLVMEYIPGRGLDEVIQTEGPLSAQRCCRILSQVADALDYAHEQGVVHRDLKPENIFLMEHRGRQDVVKVLDFGLAKILGGHMQPITVQGQIYGTPEYMAPEQIVGKNIDHRVDIYTLGALTFEMLTGRVPFTGTMMEQLLSHKKKTPPLPSVVLPEAHIPGALDELVLKAMAKDPDDRYSRALHMVEVYEQVLAELEEQAEAEQATIMGMTSSNTAQDRRASPVPGSTDGPKALEADPVDERRRLVTRLEEQLQTALYQMAQELRDRDMGTVKLTRLLARCLATGERIYGSQTEIASLVARMEEKEASGREQESRLRSAIIDLSIEQARLKDEMEAGFAGNDRGNMVADLKFQIGELEKRLLDVAAERDTQLAKLEEQLKIHRKTKEELGLEQAVRDGELLFELMAFRHQMVQVDELRPMVLRLDDLRKKIEELSAAGE